MSLEPSLINGYGIDITNYENNKYSEALDYLNRNFYDLADEIDNTPCVYDTAVNTDEFTNVVYIPAVTPVKLQTEIHIFTKEEANQALIDYIRQMLVLIQTDDDVFSFETPFTKADIEILMKNITKFVNENADEINYVDYMSTCPSLK